MTDGMFRHSHNWQLITGDFSYTPTGINGEREFNIIHSIFACECGEYKVNKGKKIVVEDYYKRI